MDIDIVGPVISIHCALLAEAFVLAVTIISKISFITLFSLVQAAFVPFSVIVCGVTYNVVVQLGDVSNSFRAGEMECTAS